MLTQEQLEAKYQAVLKDRHPADLILGELHEDQVFTLLAWELWKDGMDWGPDLIEVAMGKNPSYPTREMAIQALAKVFSYGV